MIEKNTHDSIEDSRATMSLCKLKIEILIPLTSDQIEDNYLSGKYNVAKQLMQNNNMILPIDTLENIKGLLSSNLFFLCLFNPKASV